MRLDFAEQRLAPLLPRRKVASALRSPEETTRQATACLVGPFAAGRTPPKPLRLPNAETRAYHPVQYMCRIRRESPFPFA